VNGGTWRHAIMAGGRAFIISKFYQTASGKFDGNSFGMRAAQAGSNAFIGGASAKLSGGSFSRGARYGALGTVALIGISGLDIDSVALEAMAVAAAAGRVAEIMGDDFGDAALAALVNYLRDVLARRISQKQSTGGRPLTESEKAIYKDFFPDSVLDGARVFDGKVPWYLPSGYNGITRGNRIYFREGEYNPGTAGGVELLGHELVHVQQYQQGMNWVKYLWSTRYGYYKSPYEQDAYHIDDIIKIDFCFNTTGATTC
jgi:hypothetical protein